MFKKLFGGGGGDKKKQQAAPEVNPHDTMNKLQDQIEVVQQRANKVDIDMKKHTAEALKKNNAGDKRGRFHRLFIRANF